MKIIYDSAKNEANIAKHGISFDDVHGLDWDAATTVQDDRFEYGEKRFITYALRNDRLHVLVWTWREKALRPISFRKANARERKNYG